MIMNLFTKAFLILEDDFSIQSKVMAFTEPIKIDYLIQPVYDNPTIENISQLLPSIMDLLDNNDRTSFKFFSISNPDYYNLLTYIYTNIVTRCISNISCNQTPPPYVTVEQVQIIMSIKEFSSSVIEPILTDINTPMIKKVIKLHDKLIQSTNSYEYKKTIEKVEKAISNDGLLGINNSKILKILNNEKYLEMIPAEYYTSIFLYCNRVYSPYNIIRNIFTIAHKKFMNFMKYDLLKIYTTFKMLDREDILELDNIKLLYDYDSYESLPDLKFSKIGKKAYDNCKPITDKISNDFTKVYDNYIKRNDSIYNSSSVLKYYIDEVLPILLDPYFVIYMRHVSGNVLLPVASIHYSDKEFDEKIRDLKLKYLKANTTKGYSDMGLIKYNYMIQNLFIR